MKIGIYDPYLDDLGGGEKYMMSIASYLSKKHDVCVFWDQKEDIKKITERFSLNLSKVQILKNIFSSNTSTLDRIRKTKGFDAIIFLSDGSVPLVSSKRLFIHVQQPLTLEAKSLISGFKLRRINALFFNSEFTKSLVLGGEKIKRLVIYPPVKINNKKDKRSNVILHVGRFRVKGVGNDDYKKQAVMIKAFKEMVKKGLKDWEFVMAVSVNDKDLKEFDALRREAKGFDIRFLVNKKNDELWDAYNSAKIYWHASGYGEDLNLHPEYAEHFGISTVEAMGAGAVPVVINAGGQREIVKDGVNGFLWNSLGELKEKTQMLIDSPPLINKMSLQAQKRALFFSEEKFQERIDELIRT